MSVPNKQHFQSPKQDKNGHHMGAIPSLVPTLTYCKMEEIHLNGTLINGSICLVSPFIQIEVNDVICMYGCAALGHLNTLHLYLCLNKHHVDHYTSDSIEKDLIIVTKAVVLAFK